MALCDVCCVSFGSTSFFFFSSRRRHTRFDCDWSSDVCSSDLTEPGDRVDTDRDALAMLRDFPLTGIGAGAFYAVYPMYTSAVVVTGFTRHAHDDYLQFACEFGLVFAALLGAVVLASLWTAIRAQLKRRDQQL